MAHNYISTMKVQTIYISLKSKDIISSNRILIPIKGKFKKIYMFHAIIVGHWDIHRSHLSNTKANDW